MSKFHAAWCAALLSAACVSHAALAAESIVLPGPEGSAQFGDHVKVLANGNYVVVDEGYDIDGASNVGAVTLHRPDGSLISRLHGSHANDEVGAFGVLALPSGDFVVQSPVWHDRRGAVTWVDGRHGLQGEVSEQNSLVGPGPNTTTGWFVTLLANGHYVVGSPDWGGRVGASTWCDGTRGCQGTVTASNSLHGSHSGDDVSHVFALPNGNYVVVSPNWDNGNTPDTGAITFVDGTRGLVGAVSAANSLVGNSELDHLGFPSSDITVLANGDYVVNSWYWGPSPQERYVGAVTFASGTQGIAGLVSAANSLVGVQPGDGYETFVTALDDGGYLVHGRRWDENRGALVRCAASAPCVGEWASQVVLRGRRDGDFAGSRAAGLANGAAVFSTPAWDADIAIDAGAVTLIEPTLEPAPAGGRSLDGRFSLVGSHPNDRVGEELSVLTNGNYVVGSPQWSSALAAGVGAVTWRDGTLAQGDTVSAANSLVGGSSGDAVGARIQRLASGAYVVRSERWTDTVNNRRHVGALTFCAADAPCGVGGPASPDRDNSLIGKSSGDLDYAGITPLEGDDFLLTASAFDRDGLRDVGALLWWRGATSGPIDRSNALFGTFASDALGNSAQFTRHADGSFRLFAISYGENDAGAVIYGRGGMPLLGEVDADNAVIGTPNDEHLWLTSDYDAERRQMIVGDPAGNRVVLLRPGAATQAALTVLGTDPDAARPSVRVRIAVTTQGAFADGATRVQADGGEACDGVSTGSTQEPEGHVAWSECTLEFESGGEKILRAEHLGTDNFGYASSAPLSVTLASWNLFRDGFE